VYFTIVLLPYGAAIHVASDFLWYLPGVRLIDWSLSTAAYWFGLAPSKVATGSSRSSGSSVSSLWEFLGIAVRFWAVVMMFVLGLFRLFQRKGRTKPLWWHRSRGIVGSCRTHASQWPLDQFITLCITVLTGTLVVAILTVASGIIAGEKVRRSAMMAMTAVLPTSVKRCYKALDDVVVLRFSLFQWSAALYRIILTTTCALVSWRFVRRHIEDRAARKMPRVD
jgi:hypothetical protein